MNYVIIAFKSRAHTLKFGEDLRARGISFEIINTPKEAYVGCGLSVKLNKKYLPFVRRMTALNKYDSFAGVFTYDFVGTKLVLKMYKG